MKVIKPGCRVILHEGLPGEESDTVEGRIDSVTLFCDGSATYNIRWWDGGRLVISNFSPGTFETIRPEFLEIDR